MLEELLSSVDDRRNAPLADGTSLNARFYSFTQLTRLNVPIEDTNVAQNSLALADIINSYDLLAVQPKSERAFAFACTSLNVDIISVDLSQRLSFRLKAELMSIALQRGIHFELVYGPLLRDSATRRQLFANSQALVRELRGRGIILSSSVPSVFDLRAPYDVVNLATFMGLNEHQAIASVGCNGYAVVMHARQRKAFRSFLLIRVRLENTSSCICSAVRGPTLVY